MQAFPPTIIYRHKKENKKKCSLEPLSSNKSFQFFNYPTSNLPILNNYFVLSMEGPEISPEDADMGLILIDGTWKYAEKMLNRVMSSQKFPTRTLPAQFRTAYPRKQTLCTDPERGLASIEALYLAYHLMNRPTDGLLDQYYWKDQFLELNRDKLNALSNS